MSTGKAEALDLRKIKEAAQAKAEKPSNLVDREETFNLTYHSPEGKTLQATLVSRIMSGDERHVVSRMCALMANGVNFASLPLGDQARFYALAVCSVQLREPPHWVAKWLEEDARLLDAVFAQVEGHDRRYFRGDIPEGGVGAELPRVEITPIKPAADSA